MVHSSLFVENSKPVLSEVEESSIVNRKLSIINQKGGFLMAIIIQKAFKQDFFSPSGTNIGEIKVHPVNELIELY